MAEPIKIAIVIEGGVLQAVLTAGVPVHYVLVDYDSDGVEPENIREIPQEGGYTAPAFVEAGEAEADGAFVLQTFGLAADDGKPAPGGEPMPYAYAETLARYDAGELDDEQAIKELRDNGWSEKRAYVILEEHQNS